MNQKTQGTLNWLSQISCFSLVHNTKHQFSKCVPQVAAAPTPGNLLQYQFWGPTPDLLNNKLWGWGRAVCFNNTWQRLFCTPVHPWPSEKHNSSKTIDINFVDSIPADSPIPLSFLASSPKGMWKGVIATQEPVFSEATFSEFSELLWLSGCLTHNS